MIIEIIFYIINFAIIILSLLLHYLKIIGFGWGEVITISVLAITAVAISMQAFATKKMARYQLLPTVDVNMIYENGEKRTYFWFSNSSKLPAIASFKLIKKSGEKCQLHTQSLRIPPKQKMCTMTIPFYELDHSTKEKREFKPSEGEKVTLNVCIKLALKGSNIGYTFEKNYNFHEFPPKSNSYRWDETSWGYPDLPWPGQTT